MPLAHLVISCFILLFTIEKANAITLDAFLDDGSVSSTSTVGATKTLHIPSTKAVGGGARSRQRNREAARESLGLRSWTHPSATLRVLTLVMQQ